LKNEDYTTHKNGFTEPYSLLQHVGALSLVTEVQSEKISNLAFQATKKLPKTTRK
jgi:hypothetical protein